MIKVDCPWCDGSATVDVAEGDEFGCAGCAIRVELSSDPSGEPVARAA
jgi:hypothetical protein